MYRTITTLAAIGALTSLHLAFGMTPPVTVRTPKPVAVTPPPEPAAPVGDPECTSLLGKPLYAPPIPGGQTRRGQLEANLNIAKRGYDLHPNGEGEATLYGRRLAALGKFNDAIGVFSKAIEARPESYRLLRHRAHRYLTLRKFDLAIADLNKAWDLAKDKPDAPEAELDPKPGATPTSTDKSNILYHLGLAYYFKGEFNKAAETFAKRADLSNNETLSDDTKVSFINWHYLSLLRAGNKDAATKVLGECKIDMNPRDSDAYVSLLRMYHGDIAPDVLAPGAETNVSTNLVMAYGVGAWKVANGDSEGARKIFSKLAGNPIWPSFGVVAAEAELAREQTAGVDTSK